MTDEELDALIALVADAVKRIGRVRNPRRRAQLSHRLVRAVHQASVDLGPVRQAAVHEVGAAEAAAGRKLTNRDIAKMLGTDVVVAGRIKNAKLKRDVGPGE